MRASVTLMVEFEATVDIDTLEGAVLEAGRSAMRQLLSMASRELEGLPPGCPTCGGTRGCWDGYDPRAVATSFGRIVIPRRRWRCQTCQQRHRPLDRLLAPLGTGMLTTALRQACVEAGASWPYATAARFLVRRTGAIVSAETVRQCVLASGRERAACQQAEAQSLLAPTAEQIRHERTTSYRRTRRGSRAIELPPPPEQLVVELDGGWVPLRDAPTGQQQMEGKVAVLFTGQVPLGDGRHRLWPRRYVGTFAPAAELGRRAYATACHLGGERATEQVVVADGAQWIKEQTRLHFPQARTILDWPHVARALHQAIRAARPGRRHRTVRRELHHQVPELVWHGQLDAALDQLRTLRVVGDRCEALERAIVYLDGQRDWLGNYAAWQQAGYPIGSGAVEREVAVVINGRMKGRGMRWTRDGADALLAVRIDACNDAWEQRPPPPWLRTASPH